MGAETVTRFAGLAMANRVGKDDEIPIDIQQLSGSKKGAGEAFADELLSGPGGSMQDHDRIGDIPLGVGQGLAVGRVMKLQLGKHFTGTEAEVVDDVVGFVRLGQLRSFRWSRQKRTLIRRNRAVTRASMVTPCEIVRKLL